MSGLAGLAPFYDAIICDIWGVVHDGQTAALSACKALSCFRAQGKPVLLLSNAPRPASSVRDLLDRMGVPRQAYDAILTSGDLTRSYLAERRDWMVFHLGPARDLPLFDQLPVQLVSIDKAQLIVCTGPFDDETETPDDYRERLTDWSKARLPMICANPDLMVERGPRLIPCAGAIAQIYQIMGGQVTYFGKPHAPAYTRAKEILSSLERTARGSGGTILAIGDAIATDIIGAAANNIDALFITGGIHAASDHDELIDALAKASLKPIAMMRHLAW